MKLRIYQVDAFTDKVFSVNPAAICPLNKWLPDNIMQHIAMENNLSETVFYIKKRKTVSDPLVYACRVTQGSFTLTFSQNRT